jgi:hypothetical protein
MLFHRRPSRSSVVKWPAILFLVQLIACSDRTKQPTIQVTLEETKRKTDIFPKWGLTSAIRNDWELQAWTLGAEYQPGHAIGFAVRLMYRGKTKEDLPKCHLDITLIGPTEKAEETRAEVTPLFEKIAGDPPTWEAIIENPFPEKDKSYRSKSFGVGNYVLRIHARMNDTMDMELKYIPFKLLYGRK